MDHVGVALSLVAPATVAAQQRLVLRGVAAATMADGLTRSALAGAGVGVDVGEFLEVVAEGALAPGLDYPPAPTPVPVAGGGFPTTFIIVLVSDVRVDRYVLGGLRLLAPTDVVRPFGEVAGGWSREASILHPPAAAPEGRFFTSGFVSLGGGVEVRLPSHLEVFAGYRYVQDTKGDSSFHSFHAGVGFGFGAP